MVKVQGLGGYSADVPGFNLSGYVEVFSARKRMEWMGWCFFNGTTLVWK